MGDTNKVSSEWKEVRLGDVISIIGGGTPKTKIEEYWNGNIPWLSVKDFGGDNKKVWDTEKSISKLGLEKSSTKLLNKGDLIISARGTVGELAQLGKPMAFNQSCYGLRAKEDSTTNNFVYYALKNILKDIKNATHGSVFDTITKNTFDKLSINLPSLDKQNKISKILNDLDDKIELNNQMNQTLEEMAQAIFKEWFVEFNFPNEDGVPYKDNGGEMEESELGEIPKGWRVEEFYNIAEFVNGKVFKEKDYCKINKKLPIVKIAELKSGITSQTRYSVEDIPEKYFLNNSNILFSWSGNPETSLDAFIWTMGKAVLNQHIFKVDKKNISKGLIYTILKYHMKFFKEMARNKQTTGLGHVTVKNLKEYKIPIPNEDVLEKIEDVFKGYFEKIFSIHLENQTLINTRDTLLPKLMSGEVRV